MSASLSSSSNAQNEGRLQPKKDALEESTANSSTPISSISAAYMSGSEAGLKLDRKRIALLLKDGTSGAESGPAQSLDIVKALVGAVSQGDIKFAASWMYWLSEPMNRLEFIDLGGLRHLSLWLQSDVAEQRHLAAGVWRILLQIGEFHHHFEYSLMRFHMDRTRFDVALMAALAALSTSRFPQLFARAQELHRRAIPSPTASLSAEHSAELQSSKYSTSESLSSSANQSVFSRLCVKLACARVELECEVLPIAESWQLPHHASAVQCAETLDLISGAIQVCGTYPSVARFQDMLKRIDEHLVSGDGLRGGSDFNQLEAPLSRMCGLWGERVPESLIQPIAAVLFRTIVRPTSTWACQLLKSFDFSNTPSFSVSECSTILAAIGEGCSKHSWTHVCELVNLVSNCKKSALRAQLIVSDSFVFGAVRATLQGCEVDVDAFCYLVPPSRWKLQVEQGVSEHLTAPMANRYSMEPRLYLLNAYLAQGGSSSSVKAYSKRVLEHSKTEHHSSKRAALHEQLEKALVASDAASGGQLPFAASPAAKSGTSSAHTMRTIADRRAALLQSRRSPAPSVPIDPRFRATYLSSSSLRKDVIQAIREACLQTFSVALKLNKHLVNVTICQAELPPSGGEHSLEHWQGTFCRAVQRLPDASSDASPEEKDFEIEFFAQDESLARFEMDNAGNQGVQEPAPMLAAFTPPPPPYRCADVRSTLTRHDRTGAGLLSCLIGLDENDSVRGVTPYHVYWPPQAAHITVQHAELLKSLQIPIDGDPHIRIVGGPEALGLEFRCYSPSLDLGSTQQLGLDRFVSRTSVPDPVWAGTAAELAQQFEAYQAGDEALYVTSTGIIRVVILTTEWALSRPNFSVQQHFELVPRFPGVATQLGHCGALLVGSKDGNFTPLGIHRFAIPHGAIHRMYAQSMVSVLQELESRLDHKGQFVLYLQAF